LLLLCVLIGGVALYALALQLVCLCTLFIVSCYYHQTFNNYAGGQSVNFVLLWQPSDCIK